MTGPTGEPVLDIQDEPYDGPVAAQLIAEVQAEYATRYGSGDDSPVDAREFAGSGGRFLVGYRDALPVAMGGVRRHDGITVEIKRMYVVPACRGMGLSRLMLTALERAAADLGASRVILETGERQPEAMRLYETSGYARIEGFGHYRCSPMSVSYAKSLVGTADGPAATDEKRDGASG
jgi:GNAT superfamily N-acetyltransferase